MNEVFAGFRCPILIAACVALLVAACESRPMRTPRQEERMMHNLEIAPGADGAQAAIKRFDVNRNGEVTREEMDSTVAADFLTADTNGDRKLDAEEVRAANEKRWVADASQSSPLIDWNQDGYVDMTEFSNSARALFERFDLDSSGTVTEDEINARLPGAGPRRVRQ